jgi:glycosyltransferase involved in cell wall biosynthesis
MADGLQISERAEGRVPLLSVLVCTKNRPAMLHAAVESILRQSFRDFELIVVDQSTSGESKARLEGFGDPRLVYIWTDTVGLARSRNIAIRASRAEIIVFTDDDCVCDEDWLASIVEEYRRDGSIAGVYGRVLPYGPARPGLRCVCTNESLERRVYDRPISHILLGGGCNFSFRKEVFRQIGLYIESLGAGTWMGGGEDAEFMHRALLHRTRILYSPEPLTYHNKWLDRAGFARMMLNSVLCMATVLTKFALELDGFSYRHLLRLAYYLLRNRFGTDSRWRGFAMLGFGVLMGVRYRFVSPPRLPRAPVPPQALAARPSWRESATPSLSG